MVATSLAPRNIQRHNHLVAIPVGHTPVEADLRQRAETLLQQKIAYVDQEWFRHPDAETRIAALEPDAGSGSSRVTSPVAGIAFVSGLVAESPLTGPEEKFLFTRMNFLRFRAAVGQQSLKPRRPSARQVAQIEADLAEANELRNRIVQANLRLVVSVARKLAGSLDQLSELISEGLLPMIRAVELFNIQLGNRFSTYATWAVRNQMLRSLKKRKNAHEFNVTEDEISLSQIADPRTDLIDASSPKSDSEPLIGRMLAQLPERERQILAARFGLNGNPEGQSLAELSEQFGLSKERVRQIAIKALSTLQQRVAGIEDPEEILHRFAKPVV
ncbi:sigma-70 family RNA polymerase sigma factor [Planctellipticum variicoloris]|uniref:sigma-70 family RNA polymerase sigma factor n=1 Tax=Planctellipticum variicoloris TaxID=3064265 RepID=UPI003013A080|nr:sigma-70 family RNA polymerase sigma factor [Planctomycetaceae bacterium SH412]